MKKLILILVLLCKNNTSNSYFEFLDHKLSGALSPQFIQKVISIFKPTVFFETGTYSAATTLTAAPYFKNIITVELHDKLFIAAKKKLARHNHIKVYHGKSPDIIRTLGSSLKGTILFWLDAHYCGEGTALSSDKLDDPNSVTAIRGELQAIYDAHIEDCVILIDDIRGFGSVISGQEYLGCWAYPSIQEIEEALCKINPNFELALIGDILLAYDKYKYNPAFSDTVLACTKTRLYDGYDLSDEELLYWEEKIKQAPAHEKQYIRQLYTMMTDYKDPMFWHDLWYGLSELGSGNHKAAYAAFSKIPHRGQKTIINYSHPRIDYYIKSCKP